LKSSTARPESRHAQVHRAWLYPMPFCEGKYGGPAGVFLELPRGQVVAHFDLTDMKRAKDVLKNHTCIMGNVPSALLQLGTPQQ